MVRAWQLASNLFYSRKPLLHLRETKRSTTDPRTFKKDKTCSEFATFTPLSTTLSSTLQTSQEEKHTLESPEEWWLELIEKRPLPTLPCLLLRRFATPSRKSESTQSTSRSEVEEELTPEPLDLVHRLHSEPLPEEDSRSEELKTLPPSLLTAQEER